MPDETEMNIISASRRTDIPAFYMPWLMRRLDAGFARYPNPFGGKVCTVSLRPEHVHSLVFWSKHFGPFLNPMDEIEQRGYRFYCHYTITGAPRLLEPHVPDGQHNVRIFRQLADRLGPRRVLWRFDPIVYTGELNADFYRGRFRDLAEALSGATERCYFSFANFYGKVERRMQRLNILYTDPPLEEKQALVGAFADIAGEHGITLYACCQEALANDRVKRAHCVDGDLLADLFPDRPLVAALKPTREQCGCFASRDIGVYESCVHGCVYCYATQSHAAAVNHLHAHDPAGEMLIGENPKP